MLERKSENQAVNTAVAAANAFILGLLLMMVGSFLLLVIVVLLRISWWVVFG